jgi:hypothetical protein
MSLDLPADLENLKVEGASLSYDPPYEAAQGLEHDKPKEVGQVHDYTESEDPRETNTPDVKELEHPVNLDDPLPEANEANGYADGGKDIEMGHGTVGAEEFRDGE